MSVRASVLLAFVLRPWPLVAAGAATIAAAAGSGLTLALDSIAFCLLATASILVMEIYLVARPQAARARLDGLRRLDDHRSQVIVVLSVGGGLWLIGKSAYALS